MTVNAGRRGKHGTTLLAELVYDEVAGEFAGFAGIGRRTTLRFGTGLAESVKTFFDQRGRVVRTRHTLAGTTYESTARYDELGRPVRLTHPDGEVLEYTYGDHGQPVALVSSRHGALVRQSRYNALGRPIALDLGNGLTTSYAYWGIEHRPLGSENRSFGRLRSIQTGALQNLTHDYDLKGNLTTLGDSRLGETLSCAYDDLDRLTEAVLTGPGGPVYNESYQYTAIGTFLRKGGVDYGYPSAGSPRPHAPSWVGVPTKPVGAPRNVAVEQTPEMGRQRPWREGRSWWESAGASWGRRPRPESPKPADRALERPVPADPGARRSRRPV